MKSKSDKPAKSSGHAILKAACRLTSPVLSVLFYALILTAVLLATCALIVALVNVAPEDMMLPPFMHLTWAADGSPEGYSISVGNGLRMYAEYADVTLGDIKTVIYAAIVIACAALLTWAPICRFLSALTRSMADGRPLEPKNARYIEYIGLTYIIGRTATLFTARLYNYALVKTFIEGGENLERALGLDCEGIAVGALIMLFGAFYSYACAEHRYALPYKAPEAVSDVAETDKG